MGILATAHHIKSVNWTELQRHCEDASDRNAVISKDIYIYYKCVNMRGGGYVCVHVMHVSMTDEVA